jgi:hypothetical protein
MDTPPYGAYRVSRSRFGWFAVVFGVTATILVFRTVSYELFNVPAKLVISLAVVATFATSLLWLRLSATIVTPNHLALRGIDPNQNDRLARHPGHPHRVQSRLDREAQHFPKRRFSCTCDPGAR